MLNRPVSDRPAVSGAQQWSDSVKARLPSRLEVSVDFDGDNSTGRLSFKRFEYSRPSGKEVSGSEAFGSGGSAFMTERDLWEYAICDAIQKFVAQNPRVYGWKPNVVE
jgi:hypothetical protein